MDDCKFDFFCLVETWQQENDFLELNHVCPPGFVYISQPRISRRGGGLAILHKSIYKASPLTVSTYASFESVALSISGPTPTVLAVHVDSASNSFTRDFNSCLDSFGLHQYVDFPTHSKGHTLDLICCLGVTPLDCTATVILLRNIRRRGIHLQLVY